MKLMYWAIVQHKNLCVCVSGEGVRAVGGGFRM
jgi:hypothetical protein